MQLLPNNYNSLMLRGVQLLDGGIGSPTQGQWVTQNAIPFSVTFYDTSNNPMSGLTALTIPNVTGSQGDYLLTLIVGAVAAGSTYRMLLTSTGGFAGYVTVDNSSIFVPATRVA